MCFSHCRLTSSHHKGRSSGSIRSLYSVSVTGSKAAILSIERQWFHSAAMLCTQMCYTTSVPKSVTLQWNLKSANKSKRSSADIVFLMHNLFLLSFTQSWLVLTTVFLFLRHLQVFFFTLQPPTVASTMRKENKTCSSGFNDSWLLVYPQKMTFSLWHNCLFHLYELKSNDPWVWEIFLRSSK